MPDEPNTQPAVDPQKLVNEALGVGGEPEAEVKKVEEPKTEQEEKPAPPVMAPTMETKIPENKETEKTETVPPELLQQDSKEEVPLAFAGAEVKEATGTTAAMPPVVPPASMPQMKPLGKAPQPKKQGKGRMMGIVVGIVLLITAVVGGAIGYELLSGKPGLISWVDPGGGGDGCGAGEIRCNGVCKDVTSSNSNCGGCNVRCDSDEECKNGVCKLKGTTSCAAGQIQCGGSCCASSTQVCQNEKCVLKTAVQCPTGQTNCNGYCRDLQTDINHCGVCGTKCSIEGQVCVGGQCTYQCAAGYQWDLETESCIPVSPGGPVVCTTVTRASCETVTVGGALVSEPGGNNYCTDDCYRCREYRNECKLPDGTHCLLDTDETCRYDESCCPKPPASNPPSPEAPTLACTSLSKNLVDSAIKVDSVVQLTCAGSITPAGAANLSYAFRWQKDGGSWTSLTASGASASFTVLEAGTYLAQCRTCATIEGENKCTEWGAAQ